MTDWMRAIVETAIALVQTYGWWVAGISCLMLVASLLVIRVLLVRMPDDYFIRHTPLLAGIQHPVWEICLLVLKNVTGFVLVLLGLIMSLPGVAGQGILTTVAGSVATELGRPASGVTRPDRRLVSSV